MIVSLRNLSIVAAMTLTLCGAVHAQCFGKQTQSFLYSWQVVAADFNHDGFPDLATVGRLPGYRGFVSIYLADGAGTFIKPGSHYYEQDTVADLAVGDFNNDGNVDIVDVDEFSYGGPEGINVLLGSGDGTFYEHTHRQLFQRDLEHVTVGDFNGDGNLDAVVWGGQSQFFAWFVGKGDGTLIGPFSVAPTMKGIPFLLLAGDYNRDGISDLALVNFADSGRDIRILLGSKNGTFLLSGTYNSETRGVIALVEGDFNEDGFLDVAASTGRPDGIAVLLGIGNGSFQSPIHFPAMRGDQLVAADFNGDGQLDLFTGASYGSMWSILIGNGDGTFQNPVNHLNLPAPEGIAVADFDQDGLADLAISDGYHFVGVFPNLGDCP